jgi:signal transduction histidine kinase
VSIADDEEVTVRVRDEGPGFDPDARHEGFGLIGIRERIELIGGTLRVDSGTGTGTTIEASLPVRRRGKAVPDQLHVAS